MNEDLLHSIQNSFKKFKKFAFESDPYAYLLLWTSSNRLNYSIRRFPNKAVLLAAGRLGYSAPEARREYHMHIPRC